MNATTIDATMIATIVSAVITALQGNDTAQNIAVAALPKNVSKAKEKEVTVNKGTEEKARIIVDGIPTAYRHSYVDGNGTKKNTVQVCFDRKVKAWKSKLAEAQSIDKGAYYSKATHAIVFQSPTKETEKAIRQKYGTIKKAMPKEHIDYIEKRRALNEAKKA